MENTKHKFVRVAGRMNGKKPQRRVSIHERNSEQSPIIGMMQSEDMLPYLGQADGDPHMYRVLYPTNNSSVGYVTSNERYTEVVYKI